MDIKSYLDSGIAQLYILGYASDDECREFESLMTIHPEIRAAFELHEQALANMADDSPVEPHPNLKPLILATFDYISRLESGEELSIPPILNENSTIEDFQLWIDREDMVAPEDFEEVHAKIIASTPEMTCAMVWIKNMAPEEVHTNEYEKFLILEGSCTIVVGAEENKLVAGDYFAIPLFEDHKVIVTSEEPCVVILQRIAA
ncbi:MAG: cupin domain-containing protein [Bacteroidota bacterium]